MSCCICLDDCATAWNCLICNDGKVCASCVTKMPIEQCGKCPVCRTCDDSYKLIPDDLDNDAEDALYSSLINDISEYKNQVNDMEANETITEAYRQRYIAYLDNMQDFVDANATINDMRRIADELAHWYHAITNNN